MYCKCILKFGVCNIEIYEIIKNLIYIELYSIEFYKM